MGAKNFWLGTTDSNCETAANWSLAAVPVDTNELIFQSSANNCTGDLRVAEDIDPDALRVIGSYSGSIGTDASSPFKLADFTAGTGVIEIDVADSPSQAIFLDVTSCPNVVIRSTGSGPNACYIVAGALTDVWILGGQRVIFGPSVTIASGGTVIIDQEQGRGVPQVEFKSGFAMNSASTLILGRGRLKSYAALAGTVRVEDGLLEQVGDVTGNIGTLEVSGEGRVNLWSSAAFTCTLARLFGRAVIDTTQSTRGWTFTNVNAAGNSELRGRSSVDVYSNAPRVIGKAKVTAASLAPLTQM